MAEIGEMVLNQAADFVRDSLLSKQKIINKTYLKEEELLDINLKITLSPAKNKIGVRVRQTLKFVSETVKDSKMVELSEDQMDLFSKDKK